VRYVVVSGTGTEVGKTFVAHAVLCALRERGQRVAARKPVQSFAPEDASTDADVLAAATGEAPTTVCPAHRWLPTPMAPPMAADALGLAAFSIAELVAEVTDVERTTSDDTIVLVEGAGGVRSPLARDGDTAALADRLHPDLVVLVADAGLGTINLVRLAASALLPHTVVVYLNRFDERDDLHRRNRDWLVAHDGFDVVTDVEALTNRVAPRDPR
jgi:dethiobiotin synthetase